MGFYLKGYVHMYALTYASNKQTFYYYYYYYYRLSVIYNFETEKNVLRGNGMFDELMHLVCLEKEMQLISFLCTFYFYAHAHQVDTG